MPFSIKRFTMHRSTSLPGGRSSNSSNEGGSKKISLTEMPRKKASADKAASKADKASSAPQHASPPQLPNSRSMDAGELRRFGQPPELLADAMASRTLHSIQEHPAAPRYSAGSTATLPARWRGAPLPPRPSSQMSGSFGGGGGGSDGGGGGTEVRRLVVRKNGVRFQESDWAVDDNHSISSNKLGGRGGGGGGPPTIRPPSSLSKRAAEWENEQHQQQLSVGHSQTLKPRRHHTVGFDTGSMSTLPRMSMDLEQPPQNKAMFQAVVQFRDPHHHPPQQQQQQIPQQRFPPNQQQQQPQRFANQNQQKPPMAPPSSSSSDSSAGGSGSATTPNRRSRRRKSLLYQVLMSPLRKKSGSTNTLNTVASGPPSTPTGNQRQFASHLPNQRSHSLYQPPSSVYDEDPGIMSEVETSATGFRRASKARSSLPIVRTPSKTQERPLGLVFLQYQSETKRALLPNEITSMDTVRALFVRSFPKQLTMEYLDSPHIRVYIHDPAKDMFYELEDLRDIRDRSVLRIYEQDMNGGGVYSTYDQDLSYFSEPEFDSEYQHQHIHRSKASKAPSLPPAASYYGSLPPQYRTLPHSASMRSTYSPDRQKPTGGGVIPEETEPLEGGTLPPPKPQRSFQQALTPLGKTVRSTPPPTGPPPSIPSPRSGQPLVAIGSSMPISPERTAAYRAGGDRPYSVAGGTYPGGRYEYHSSPERRGGQESGYLSSPERRMDRSGYSTSSSYEDSLYGGGGGGGSVYGTRSGSVTPVIDEEASMHRMRMEYMERQLASLTGLVQKALTTQPPPAKQPPTVNQLQQQIPTRDCGDLAKGNGTINKEEKHLPVIKPSLYPKPSQLPVIYDRGEHATPKEVHLTPEMYCQLRHLRKQTKDLRLEVRNLRRIAQAQSVTARDTVRETCLKIKTMLSQAQSGEDQVCAERLRVSREEDLYRQDVTRLEKDLTELETHVEELRSNVINRKCRVNMCDVEGMALVLSRASKTVADLKARFPNLQDSLKCVMAAEMEVVVREEKFLKEEPDRLETALRRCKKLTGTLVTLKRLASVQEQRHTGALPANPSERSSEGNHSDGELHNVKTTLSSDPHTVIHVPPGGRPENALDALLDELQTFTKPLETPPPRDNIPGLLGPQKRLPSYPSSESPVRSPVPGETSSSSGAFRAPAPAQITAKLQVSGGDGEGQTTVMSSPKKTVKVDGVEAGVAGGQPPKKAPPPPPPRTTSRSPLTSPAAAEMPGAANFARSNSAPASDAAADARRETLSSNSSSSESVNSQEGVGGGTPGAPKVARVDALEQRHQELLRKQKLLQDQYTRLQKLQNSTMLARFSPNDLKKTGSESNILSKSGLTVTPSSGSLTHLAGSASATFDKPPPDVVVAKSAKPAPAVPAKPKNKIYETDIL